MTSRKFLDFSMHGSRSSTIIKDRVGLNFSHPLARPAFIEPEFQKPNTDDDLTFVGERKGKKASSFAGRQFNKELIETIETRDGQKVSLSDPTKALLESGNKELLQTIKSTLDDATNAQLRGLANVVGTPITGAIQSMKNSIVDRLNNMLNSDTVSNDKQNQIIALLEAIEAKKPVPSSSSSSAKTPSKPIITNIPRVQRLTVADLDQKELESLEDEIVFMYNKSRATRDKRKAVVDAVSKATGFPGKKIRTIYDDLENRGKIPRSRQAS